MLSGENTMGNMSQVQQNKVLFILETDITYGKKEGHLNIILTANDFENLKICRTTQNGLKKRQVYQLQAF